VEIIRSGRPGGRCALGAAVLRVAWSVVGVAVLAVLLMIIAMPVAAVLVTPVGEWLQERFPTAMDALVEGVLVAVGVAVLGLLVKTRLGTAVVGFAFEGMGKGAFAFESMTWLWFIALPTFPIALLIVWLIGWPDGWIGGLLGLMMGAAVRHTALVAVTFAVAWWRNKHRIRPAVADRCRMPDRMELASNRPAYGDADQDAP
jgi:hypothetical protein